MRKNILSILFFVTLMVASCGAGGTGKQKEFTPNAETYELLELFGEVFERVRMEYVEEKGEQELVESAINGMLISLDPHSSYLSEKAFKEVKVQTKGEFGGLGIEVTMDKGLVKVVSPIDDTPADKAGILAGDYITHLDDAPVFEMTLTEAVEKMRGKIGTKIKLTIIREGEPKPLDIDVIRAVIKIKSVRSRGIGKVGYIRITSFSEQTASGLKKELKKLQRGIGPEMKGLVLDLRNNPGGLLNQAIEVSSAFLNSGEVVSTRGREASNNVRYNSKRGDIAKGMRVVVLINAGSASASEIVAGALQDHKRAIIMGTKSFGKGSVQTVIPLQGHGAMRLTTAHYYTPSGRSIQAEGITPDIVVEQAKIEKIQNGKQRKEADLKGSLANPNGKTHKKGAKPDAKTPDLENPEDYQLSRAVDLIRAIAIYDSRK